MYTFLKIVQFIVSTLIWVKFFRHPRIKALLLRQWIPAFGIFFLLMTFLYWPFTDILIKTLTD